jgi:hypothetical protein
MLSPLPSVTGWQLPLSILFGLLEFREFLLIELMLPGPYRPVRLPQPPGPMT